MKPFIVRGALAGVMGGLATVLVILLLGEQSIGEAIALESAQVGGSHDEMFSRPIQMLGGSIGVTLYGIFIGTVFAIVFAANRHRLGAGPDWRRARRLAAIAFVVVYLVPFLKYAPNPPAVGSPDTVNLRTVAYLSILLVSVLATVLASQAVARFRRAGWPEHLIGPAAVALWLVVLGIAFVVLPANPDAVELPATLVWRFRLSSAAGQLVFWTVTGLVFGWLGLRADGQRVFGRSRGGPDRPRA